MEKKSFKEIVAQWKLSLPGATVPIPNKGEPQARIDSYLDLFATLLQQGYTREEIFFPGNLGIIVGVSHNANHRIASKAKNWKALVEQDLDDTRRLHPAWADESIEIVKFDRSQAVIQVPEPKVYQPNIQTLTMEKAQEPDAEESDDQVLPASPKKTHREFTKEEWDKIPEIEPEYDLELRRLLGFDNE